MKGDAGASDTMMGRRSLAHAFIGVGARAGVLSLEAIARGSESLVTYKACVH